MTRTWLSARLVTAVFGIFFTLLPGRLAAQTSLPPVDLVRQTIQNELRVGENAPKLMFKKRKQTPEGSETKLMLETQDSTAALLIAVNDKPLTADQQRAEEDRLRKLMSDPAELKREQQKEREKDERSSRMVKALPDAFIYEYDGTVTGWPGVGKEGIELTRLKFHPNPKYVPPTRVEQVLTGMQGFVLIAAKDHRLARIDGTLQKEVAFGWGILGHLNPGGHFQVDIGDVGNGCWGISRMDLAFTGKIMMVKSLDIKVTENFSDYSPAPANLSFAQAVELLKRQGEQIAWNGAKSGVN